MKKLNPIERSQYINERYKEYLKSSFELGKGELQELFIKQLNNEKLFKGPYIDIKFPFQRGKNIESLIVEGVVSSSFYNLKDINFKRPLYSHQEEAIRLIRNGRSAVITTGTGSGKTECFLYPILNDLLFDIEKGNHEVGIRAIFLYPMNALLNDQIDRIRKILCKCPDITFGFFTGDTPEKATCATRKNTDVDNECIIPDNELVSREEIRNKPPHLLFTNYSMLEYLLIRPKDYALFEPNRLKNWKYMVLDEAHTYAGSLGIELSLLLRRLTGMAIRKPQFILTSATLGEQGKSENDIIRFAKKLTSAEFDINDIIFSKRIFLQNRAEYRIIGSDYLKIKNAINSYGELNLITSNYYKGSSSNIREQLYELLSRDKNVHAISSMLKSGSKDFINLYNEMLLYISKEELISLIDIINKAEKDGIGLFELKYHSFIRPLSGAFITYGKHPKLSLTKTNEIDGLKAFEVGNCKYCKAAYIIGKIQNDENDQMNYLLQNKEVDIYENYGNVKYLKIDFFLFEKDISKDDVEKGIIEPYEVCAKCGEIHAAGNLNAMKCKCDDKYRFLLYKVIESKKQDDSANNNINHCPCCGNKGNSGIIKALNIGKDEATAIISQILYEAIDESEQEVERFNKTSLTINERSNDQKKEERVKQFLVFSDSRQQASFAALFFDRNHIRMLRKRLIWEVIKVNNYADLSVNKLISCLKEILETNDFFQNGMNPHKNAWSALLVDLLKVDGAYDGEGIGLYFFDLDIGDIVNSIDDEAINEVFENCNMSKDELYELIQIAFTVFKTTPAINYSIATFTQEEKKEILGYRRFENYVMLNIPEKEEKEEKSNFVRSFLPVKNESNMIVRYVMKIFECNSDKAKDVLKNLFDFLIQINETESSKKILIKHSKRDAYQIDSSYYKIRNYKNSKFYKCNKCGKLTPHNIRNKCPKDSCQGTLIEINPDEMLASNFYRQQYQTMKLESIVIKEHTAQLDKKTAKQYQNDFKKKQINILSCSTTFEMGVDLGELETVFMRNVPPTPANYVQRAGRAGRRKECSAYILTFCEIRSHDYTYFLEPEKMISGIISPPYFDVLNKKIISRQLMATSFGYFFRIYPEYSKNLDSLVINGGGIYKYKDYMNSHPDDLNEYINDKILPEVEYREYWNFSWYDQIKEEDDKLTHFVDNIIKRFKEFESGLNEAKLHDNSSDKKYFENQIKQLKNSYAIDSLSKGCVIPKYSFPVDVVDLQLCENGYYLNKYDITRDLKIAISEYAPDSEIVVDGKKFTSKYISLNKNSEFSKNYFITCPTCKKMNMFLRESNEIICKYCGHSISSETLEYYIEPINGFKSGETKESNQLKPARSYAGKVTYVGGGKVNEKRLVLNNILAIETSSEDELLVINNSGFYMCPVCGYSDIVKGGNKSPLKLINHKNFNMHKCANDKLEYIRLGTKFKTDVTRITIPMLSLNNKIGYSYALSFLYAFLEGVSIALLIERTDIDGVLEINSEFESYDILLFDNVPGGAGHVKRLLNKDALKDSLNEALKKVSNNCCDENTSCYNCLRNYYNQSYHSNLQRNYAIDIIKRLLFAFENEIVNYQNEHWELNSNTVFANKKMQIVLGTNGRNPGNECAKEIWEDLLDDCYDKDEIEIITMLKEKSPHNIGKPYYKKTMKIEETNEEFTANLVWYEKQVMLFLNESYDDYIIAKKTGWDVFCTSEGFNIQKVLEKVGE